MKSTAWLDGWFAHKSQDEDGEEMPNPYCERRQARSAIEWGCGWVARHDFMKYGVGLNYDDALMSGEGEET